MKAAKHQEPEYRSILGGFTPMASLWDEGSGAALFPSEVSARWFIRQHRDELIEAQALARPLRQLLVHPQRFATAMERIAVQRAARKHAA